MHTIADLTDMLILNTKNSVICEGLPAKVPSTLPVWILLILAVASSEPVMATVESALMSNDVKPAWQQKKLFFSPMLTIQMPKKWPKGFSVTQYMEMLSVIVIVAILGLLE